MSDEIYVFNDLDVVVDGADNEAMARMIAEDAMKMALEAGYGQRPGKKHKRKNSGEG